MFEWLRLGGIQWSFDGHSVVIDCHSLYSQKFLKLVIGKRRLETRGRPDNEVKGIRPVVGQPV
ncbi:MAG: hypothetical protein K9H65_02985 [Bacteroidales bacterium]|nr:hypothetical protein [Bacteroidales bacterium]